jgi:hypothetical protein
VLAEFASEGQQGPIFVGRVLLKAAGALMRDGHFEKPDFLRGRGYDRVDLSILPDRVFPDLGVPRQIANLMRWTIWELYCMGVLAPYSERKFLQPPHLRDDRWMSLDTFVITSYGMDWLLDSRNRIRTYDPDGYLANFYAAAPDPDPEMMRYLRECISVFRGNHLLASVVLLGVASERLVEVLAECLRDALGEPEGNDWYSRYHNKDISRKFTSIVGKLQDEYGERLDVNTDAFTALELTFQYMRLARNDIAHPKNRQFTANEVSGFISNFVQYFKYINDIIAFLAKNPR